LNITLPVSIPDGWVILSRSVLDLCYQHPRAAGDRLAFVLAHEIAHLLDDDFWHINFFNAIDISRTKGVSSESVLNQIKGTIGPVRLNPRRILVRKRLVISGAVNRLGILLRMAE